MNQVNEALLARSRSLFGFSRTLSDLIEEAEREFSPERVVSVVTRNRAAAAIHLRRLAREGRRSTDPYTAEVLARIRRDLLREAGVDERIVRAIGGSA